MRPDPAPQIQQMFVEAFRQGIFPGIAVSQIRGHLELSGAPKDLHGVTVQAIDRGGHGGMPGRLLVDVEVNISVWTHIDEDPDGLLCGEVVSGIRPLLPFTNGSGDDWTYPALDGWKVRYPGSWQTAGPDLSPDGNFRIVVLSGTLFLQNLN